MYFKKIELIGFKSFPEKTEISFEPGTTAIIGPNGCGKTNISDAIRWVLGETSAKSLRGQRMEDVIFSGTELHKPLSLAEVSLTLNNEDKIIPIEYSEVTVTRRCYRSGESDYFINKTPCRLRDIQELFMDTGIGTESYSVMEQGKVDLVLSSKPEDRRLVLEEAAGIAKYNARKETALRKLQLTEQNLLRIDDIIAEVKREIISVKRQVTKAEKYRESYERLKKLETSIAIKKYKGIKGEIESLQKEIDLLRGQSSTLTSEIAQEESKEEVLHLKVTDIEKALASTRERFLSKAEEVNSIENKGVALKERMEHLKARGDMAGQELREVQEKILDTQKRIEEDEKKQIQVFESIRDIESSLLEKEQSFGTHLSSVENTEKEIEEYKNRLFENMREITNLNNEIEKININLSGMEKRITTLNRERQKGRDEEESICLKIDELSKLLLEWEKSCESCSQRISEVLKEAEKITAERELGLNEKREELRSLQREIQEIPAVISSKQRESQGENITLELTELEDEKTSLSPMLIQKGEAQKLLEKERGELKEELDKKTSLFQDLKHSLEDARDAKEKARISFTSLEEKKGGMELHLVTLKERLSEYRESHARLEGEISHASSECRDFEDKMRDLEREKDGCLKEKAFFKEEMDRFEEERRKAASIFREEEGRLRRERASINKKLEGLHKLELTMAQKDAGLSSLKERMLNLYQVDMDNVSGEDIFNEDEARTEIEELRQKLQAMGSVNLLAIEENKELEDRFSLLKREREDILKAREELHQVIGKINHTCRKLFSETVEKVRVEFHNIFRFLFNGGKADLILQEGDILESGIEIVARPPGKNLSTITQLSGGEKALTAIALLFALFRIRPSPFCVLDEIDAPLDDSNIGRFGSLLKEFLKNTQFIVITHNKKTISVAQIIYGITMEEPGISKIVSVKFKKDSKVPAPSSL